VDADTLSRRPRANHNASHEKETLLATSVKAVCHMSKVRVPHCHLYRAVDLIGSSKGAVPRAYYNFSFLNTQQLPKLSAAEISNSQQKDACIGEVWHAIIQKSANHAKKEKHSDVSLLLKEWDKIMVKDSVLYRMSHPPNTPARQQLLLPQEFRTTVLQSLHDQSTRHTACCKRGFTGLA